MADDIQKCLEIYQEQLNNGYIRVAYVTLTKYVAELKANFPKAYTTSSVAFGYLYYTYFYFTNDYLMHIPQELRIRSGGTERHSASS